MNEQRLEQIEPDYPTAADAWLAQEATLLGLRIRDEVHRLTAGYVKANDGRSHEARQEAIQVAAMALRYVLDCSGPATYEERTYGPGGF